MLDNKVIQLLPDGTLTVTEPIENGEKTVRYFDSRLQMILNIVEKTKEKTVITKYMPDGHFIQSITVETKDSLTVYAPDGKTKQREKHLAVDGNWYETVYQKDGVTPYQTAVFASDGTSDRVFYQSDGHTKVQEIHQDDKGLSKTRFFAADGETLLKTGEDLSDGSTRTVYYRAGVVERVETGPLKGETASNVYLIETYDETGTKIVSAEKQSR